MLSFSFLNPDWTAVIDDKAARKCAKSFSLATKGTLAVVILAKQKGLIPSAADVMRQLLAIGFRINDAIIRQALNQSVNEDW